MRVYRTFIELPRFYHQTIWHSIQRNATTVAALRTSKLPLSTHELACANRDSSSSHSMHRYYHTQCVRLPIGSNSGRDCRYSQQPQRRQLWSTTGCRTTDKHNADEITPSLSQYQAYDMIHKLTDQERKSLRDALNQYESDVTKSKFQGELAATKWRLSFGRREKLPALGHVDPTGSYCAMPDDWLQKKLAEAAVLPTREELWKILLVNAIPFVGFGFLDNFFMIIAGDYIEEHLGAVLCLSTMAAAGLGNTISDVLGLGLAHYVEQFCEFIGLKAPKLTPAQMQMTSSRRYASFGRALGIVIGCLLGMCPLLFINKKPSKGDAEEKQNDPATSEG